MGSMRKSHPYIILKCSFRLSRRIAGFLGSCAATLAAGSVLRVQFHRCMYIATVRRRHRLWFHHPKVVSVQLPCISRSSIGLSMRSRRCFESIRGLATCSDCFGHILPFGLRARPPWLLLTRCPKAGPCKRFAASGMCESPRKHRLATLRRSVAPQWKCANHNVGIGRKKSF